MTSTFTPSCYTTQAGALPCVAVVFPGTVGRRRREAVITDQKIKAAEETIVPSKVQEAAVAVADVSEIDSSSRSARFLNGFLGGVRYVEDTTTSTALTSIATVTAGVTVLVDLACIPNDIGSYIAASCPPP